jgi:hypothetical protein
MNLEIDQTIYFIKVRALEAETLLDKDDIEGVKKELRDIYEATVNLYKLLKAEEDEQNKN